MHCIHKCIAQHQRNKKILKNTIYAIGNISYYGEKFAFQLRETVKYLLEGLSSEDTHLLHNTISTISNLLRHSNYHLQALIDSTIFARLIEIYANATTSEQVNYLNSTFRKAANYPEFFKAYPKEALRKLL